MSSRQTSIAALFLVCSALSWAGNHVVARAIAGKVPPASLNALRWFVVALLVAIVSHRQIDRDWPELRRHWKTMLLLGVLGGGIFGTLQYVGLQYTTVVNMGVMNSVAPALIALASWLMFRDAIGPIQVFGIALSLTGVLAMVSRLDLAVLQSLTFNQGDLIILANMVLFAVYSAMLRLRPKVSLPSFLFALSIPAALVNVPWAAWEHAAGYTFVPDAVGLGAVAYASLFTSIVAYVCWSRGVEALGPGRAGVFLHLIPLFNTAFGTALLGEHLQLHHVVGLMLILAGVFLTARVRPSPTAAPMRS